MCNHTGLLSVAKVTGEIAAASQQMCFVLSQPVSAKRPGLQKAHGCARADSSSEVANMQPGAEDCQKCLTLILSTNIAYIVQLQLMHNEIVITGSAQSLRLLDLPTTCKLQFQQTWHEILLKVPHFALVYLNLTSIYIKFREKENLNVVTNL